MELEGAKKGHSHLKPGTVKQMQPWEIEKIHAYLGLYFSIESRFYWLVHAQERSIIEKSKATSGSKKGAKAVKSNED